MTGAGFLQAGTAFTTGGIETAGRMGGWDTPVSWGGLGDVCMNVLGTEGVLNLNFTPMELYAVPRDGWRLPDTRHWPKMDGKYVGAVNQVLEHYLNCILNSTEPRVTGADGRCSVEIMLAAENSIAEDRVGPCRWHRDPRLEVGEEGKLGNPSREESPRADYE